MEQEIKKLTKAVDKLARELKRYNDTKNAGPAGEPGNLPDVKVSLGQRNEGRTFANMLARAMDNVEDIHIAEKAYCQSDKQVREKLEEIAAALKAEQVKKYRSRGGQN